MNMKKLYKLASKHNVDRFITNRPDFPPEALYILLDRGVITDFELWMLGADVFDRYDDNQIMILLDYGYQHVIADMHALGILTSAQAWEFAEALHGIKSFGSWNQRDLILKQQGKCLGMHMNMMCQSKM